MPVMVMVIITVAVLIIASITMVPIHLFKKELAWMEIDGDGQAWKPNRRSKEKSIVAIVERLIDDGASDHNGEPVKGMAMMVRIVVDPAGLVVTVISAVPRINPARHMDMSAAVRARRHAAPAARGVPLVGRHPRTHQQGGDQGDNYQQDAPNFLLT
jgi:hypothetical protein